MTKFNFRAVKTADKKYNETRAHFEAAGIKFDETSVDGAVVSIQRVAESHELPVVDVAELVAEKAEFVADIIAKLVETTARKMFIDNCKPVAAITLADIIRCNTAQVRTAVSKEAIEAFAAFAGDIMAQAGMPAGSISTVQALINGRFNSAICNKFMAASDNFPSILGGLKKYKDSSPEAVEAFGDVYDLLETNLTNWVEAQNTEEEELDFTAM